MKKSLIILGLLLFLPAITSFAEYFSLKSGWQQISIDEYSKIKNEIENPSIRSVWGVFLDDKDKLTKRWCIYKGETNTDIPSCDNQNIIGHIWLDASNSKLCTGNPPKYFETKYIVEHDFLSNPPLRPNFVIDGICEKGEWISPDKNYSSEVHLCNKRISTAKDGEWLIINSSNYDKFKNRTQNDFYEDIQLIDSGYKAANSFGCGDKICKEETKPVYFKQRFTNYNTFMDPMFLAQPQCVNGVWKEPTGSYFTRAYICDKRSNSDELYSEITQSLYKSAKSGMLQYENSEYELGNGECRKKQCTGKAKTFYKTALRQTSAECEASTNKTTQICVNGKLVIPESSYPETPSWTYHEKCEACRDNQVLETSASGVSKCVQTNCKDERGIVYTRSAGTFIECQKAAIKQGCDEKEGKWHWPQEQVANSSSIPGIPPDTSVLVSNNITSECDECDPSIEGVEYDSKNPLQAKCINCSTLGKDAINGKCIDKVTECKEGVVETKYILPVSNNCNIVKVTKTCSNGKWKYYSNVTGGITGKKLFDKCETCPKGSHVRVPANFISLDQAYCSSDCYSKYSVQPVDFDSDGCADNNFCYEGDINISGTEFAPTKSAEQCNSTVSKNLPDSLEKCSPFTEGFKHPLTGEEMSREVIGLKDGLCNYVEEIPGGEVECKYNEEIRKVVAQYYRDVVSLVSNEYTINETKVSNPLEYVMTNGQCVKNNGL